MQNIKVLPRETIVQIAAGEVVQRPASVVKELIENSLDAKATRIELELEDSGFKLISVRDDGIGMTANNAVLALKHHATSKITSVSDLQNISTLGFRGEALPSIAAVSQLELITSTRNALAGVRIHLDGKTEPHIDQYRPIAGTWVSVRNLFFNTPARLKFLKSKRTELKHITEVVTRLALTRPDVSFRAFHQQRELITTSGTGNRKEVVELILGKTASIPWLDIDTKCPWGRLWGYVAPPEFARKSRNHQIVIVNGRWVKSPLLVSAVEAAARSQLIRGCYPVFCLELELNPKLLDVNVHPAKLEVRFSREREIWQFIHKATKNALQPHTVSSPPNQRKQQPQQTNFSQGWFKEARSSYIVQPDRSPSVVQQFDLPTAQTSRSPKWPRLTFIGQTLNTYLIFTSPTTGIYLLDQHAAHERILFEQIVSDWEQDNLTLQHLLTPHVFTLSETEMAWWQQKNELWQQLGIVLEQFGPRTLALRSVPQIMPVETAITLVYELLNEEPDDQYNQLTWDQQRRHFKATLACHAAIKAGQNITAEDANLLIDRLSRCKHPHNCPHGRPTLISITKEELDRRFRRRGV